MSENTAVNGKRTFKSRSRREKIANVLALVIVIVLSAIVLLPIWWIFRSSLMSNAELYKYPPSFLPSRWLFSNYATTLEFFKFWLYFGNTMKIIVPCVFRGVIFFSRFALAPCCCLQW